MSSRPRGASEPETKPVGRPASDADVREARTGEATSSALPEAALERLVAGVAHDLNNLTTAIRTSVDAMRVSLEEGATDTLPTSLDRIDRAAEQSSSLMHALAGFGRTEAQPVPNELNAMLAASGQFLRRVLGTEVDLELPDPMTSSVVVEADLAMWVRALAQICGRAAAGSGRIRLSSAGREVVIELSPRTASAHRVLPTDDELAKARPLLGSFGAHLSLSFADGRGGWEGRVRMTPARPLERPRAPGPQAARRGVPDAPLGHALVAEDHEQVRAALIDALSRCGFEVEAVTDGDTLVERGLVDRERHDVLLVDYDLPGRNGASALESLREAGIRTPALMISGNVDFRPRFDRLENTEFLQKPFGLADIRAWARLHHPSVGESPPPDAKRTASAREAG